MALVEGGQQAGGPGEAHIAAPEAAEGVTSPAWTSLLTDIATFRATITGRGEAHRTSIRSTAEAEAARFRAAVEAEAQAVDDAHREAIDAVRTTADADAARIDAALDTRLAAVDAVATAERANLDDTVVAKQAAVRTRGATRGNEAGTVGTRLANKATGGTQERVDSAQAMAGTKRNQYATVENGAEIVEAINSSTRDLVAKLTKTGNDIASSVQAKTTEMAGKIRKEADDVAAEFASVRADARAQIDEGAETTKTQMRRIAGDTKAKIAEQAEKATTALQDQRAGRVAEIRGRADTADAIFAEQATAAEQEVSTREAADLTDLATFETHAADAGWYAPFVEAARVELTGALEERQAGTAELATRVSAQFTAAGDELIADISSHAQELAGGARKVAEEFATASGDMADEAEGKLGEALDRGTEATEAVTPAVGRELDRATDDADRSWQDQLREQESTLDREVDDALRTEDDAVRTFGRDIDERAAEAQDEGFLDAVWDFVAGVFEGLVLGAWEMLKAVWEAIKTPLFWIVVAIVVVILVIAVVILVIKGAAVLAAIAAVLAFAGKVLLVIGVIAGVLAAAYYVYLMIARPDLTWRERGQMLGRAILEVALAFAGTGILKRLGVFAQVAKLQAFVKRVGSIGMALRLINLLPDLEKLVLLLDRVQDAGKLVRLLEKVRDVDTLLDLLTEVRNVDTLLAILDKTSDGARVLRLLRNAKVASAEELLRLLGNPKITDAAVLERLLGNAKIGDAATLERLLGNARIRDAATLERLLSNPKIVDAAMLEALLGNAKITDIAVLERLLGNAKITDVADLVALLGNAKIADVAVMERLLANAKITDAALLRRLIGNAKVSDVAQLEDLLNLVDDGARLERLLDHADDGAQLARFLRNAGDPANSALLLELMEIAVNEGRAGNAVEDLAALVAGNAAEFRRIGEIAKRFRGRTPVSGPAGPAMPPYPSSNMQHICDEHTYAHYDFTKTGPNGQSFWPVGFDEGRVAAELQAAVDHLNVAGNTVDSISMGPTGLGRPTPLTVLDGAQPNSVVGAGQIKGPVRFTLPSGITIQLGTQLPNTAPSIGQFFPRVGAGVEHLAKDLLDAIGKIVKP